MSLSGPSIRQGMAPAAVGRVLPTSRPWRRPVWWRSARLRENDRLSPKASAWVASRRSISGAHGRVDGLLLRNPPPLRELIHYRTSWWTPGLVPALVARGIPETIDSVGNAAGCKVPALFITASQDQVVPVEYQYRIIDAYGGDYRVLEQPQGGHATPLSESEMNQLERLTAWLLGNLDNRCDASDTR